MNNLKEAMNHNEKMLEKYGFVIHSVFPTEEDEDIMWDSHTHGLKENFNHIDLQIVLPMNPNIVGAILHGMVNSIKEGYSFENQSVSDRVIENYNVQLVRVNDGDRELLRVVLPDVNGKFPCDEGCEDIYKNQLDDIISNNPNSLN